MIHHHEHKILTTFTSRFMSLASCVSDCDAVGTAAPAGFEGNPAI
jgi:hypothetical protein